MHILIIKQKLKKKKKKKSKVLEKKAPGFLDWGRSPYCRE
jgi:hypothetical protein